MLFTAQWIKNVRQLLAEYNFNMNVHLTSAVALSVSFSLGFFWFHRLIWVCLGQYGCLCAIYFSGHDGLTGFICCWQFVRCCFTYHLWSVSVFCTDFSECSPDSDSETSFKIGQYLMKLKRTKSVPVFGPPHVCCTVLLFYVFMIAYFYDCAACFGVIINKYSNLPAEQRSSMSWRPPGAGSHSFKWPEWTLAYGFAVYDSFW